VKETSSQPQHRLDIVDLAPAAADADREITGRWQIRTWWRRIATVALLGAIVTVLLLNAKRSESALSVLAHAHPAWVAAIVGTTTATYAMAATCTIGSTTTPITARRTIVMQLASTFVNRFVPSGVGGAVLNVRYLERAGAQRREAITANALNSIAGLVLHLALFAALLPFFGGIHRDVDPPDDSPAYIAILIALIALGAAAWIRWLPQHWKGHVRVMQRAASDVLSDPRRLTLLLTGSAGVTLAHGAGLWCALRAVHAPVTPADVMVVYLAAAAAAALSPTPGGLGAIEVALVTGLTRTGTPAVDAAAAVLIYRFITYWIPVLPGYVAFRHLRRTGAI
jgi:undecaprenyl-diphosphatase